MKNLKLIFCSLMIMSMTAACAKKDSEFAARYARNRMGAPVADGKKTQEAAENAEAQGLLADVVRIESAYNNSQSAKIEAFVLINDQEMLVSTTHARNSGNYDASGVAQGTVEKAGFTIVFRSFCASNTELACSRYYASLEIYKNGALVIQEGVLRDFVDPDKNRYQWYAPDSAKSFEALTNVLYEASLVDVESLP
ncbi:hypothetical protein [Bdellovibrio reynosensis]|uniref:DUF4468 domain-containing protein n=1 Tax=Bdellovibrio reynosensis TaxID=2835041 RepID=A0ABY4CC38_9BACT|nr:hypothetical protein [Bdellovibrio reynosensis]UOF02009.1 hypothetical protein MNR06_03455 [Bdellovibrio reynosensis]